MCNNTRPEMVRTAKKRFERNKRHSGKKMFRMGRSNDNECNSSVKWAEN